MSLEVLPRELDEHWGSYLDQHSLFALTLVNRRLNETATPLLYKNPDLSRRTADHIYCLFQTVRSNPQLGKRIKHLKLGAQQEVADASPGTSFSVPDADSETALNAIRAIVNAPAVPIWRETLFERDCCIALLAYLVCNAPQLEVLVCDTPPSRCIHHTVFELVHLSLKANAAHAFQHLRQLDISLERPQNERRVHGTVLLLPTLERLVLRNAGDELTFDSTYMQSSHTTQLRTLEIVGCEFGCTKLCQLLETGYLSELTTLRIVDRWWNPREDYTQLPRILARKCTTLLELEWDFNYLSDDEDVTHQPGLECLQQISSLRKLRKLRIHRDLLFHRDDFDIIPQMYCRLPSQLGTLTVTGFPENLIEKMVEEEEDPLRAATRGSIALHTLVVVVDFDAVADEILVHVFAEDGDKVRTMVKVAETAGLDFSVHLRHTGGGGIREYRYT